MHHEQVIEQQQSELNSQTTRKRSDKMAEKQSSKFSKNQSFQSRKELLRLQQQQYQQQMQGITYPNVLPVHSESGNVVPTLSMVMAPMVSEGRPERASARQAAKKSRE